MTRRPVQQARRITDRNLIADWPEREPFDWSPIRARPVDIIALAVSTVAFSLVLAAVVIGLIWAGTR